MEITRGKAGSSQGELRKVKRAWQWIFAPHPLKVQAGQSPACSSWSSQIPRGILAVLVHNCIVQDFIDAA